MQPIHLPGAVPFGKPTDWDDEKDGACLVLPVVREGGTCTSVWTFTETERAQIARGQNLVLQVVGGQPPVMLSVQNIQGPPAWDPVPSTAKRESWWATFVRVCCSARQWSPMELRS